MGNIAPKIKRFYLFYKVQKLIASNVFPWFINCKVQASCACSSPAFWIDVVKRFTSVVGVTLLGKFLGLFLWSFSIKLPFKDPRWSLKSDFLKRFFNQYFESWPYILDHGGVQKTLHVLWPQQKRGFESWLGQWWALLLQP